MVVQWLGNRHQRCNVTYRNAICKVGYPSGRQGRQQLHGHGHVALRVAQVHGDQGAYRGEVQGGREVLQHRLPRGVYARVTTIIDHWDVSCHVYRLDRSLVIYINNICRSRFFVRPTVCTTMFYVTSEFLPFFFWSCFFFSFFFSPVFYCQAESISQNVTRICERKRHRNNVITTRVDGVYTLDSKGVIWRASGADIVLIVA